MSAATPTATTLTRALNSLTVYVETAMMNPGATVTITTGTTSFNRFWKVKVTYIECFSPSR